MYHVFETFLSILKISVDSIVSLAARQCVVSSLRVWSLRISEHAPVRNDMPGNKSCSWLHTRNASSWRIRRTISSADLSTSLIDAYLARSCLKDTSLSTSSFLFVWYSSKVDVPGIDGITEGRAFGHKARTQSVPYIYHFRPGEDPPSAFRTDAELPCGSV